MEASCSCLILSELLRAQDLALHCCVRVKPAAPRLSTFAPQWTGALFPLWRLQVFKPAGPALGFGTSRFRLLLEDAVTDFSKVQQVAQQLALLRGGQHFTEPQLRIQVNLQKYFAQVAGKSSQNGNGQ